MEIKFRGGSIATFYYHNEHDNGKKWKQGNHFDSARAENLFHRGHTVPMKTTAVAMTPQPVSPRHGLAAPW